ncbi:Dual specificity protein phosphatase cdc14a [Mortierella sp. AD094]|nr:Dual specificity protein phosphatase cdc14a [Mortierella sp. AD094]
MPPGMTFNAPELSIEVPPNLSTPPPSNTCTHAGKKHPSTPPPPPIPPRSQRRPIKAASTAVSSSSSSTDLGQRIKLFGHVSGSGSEESREATAAETARRSSQNMTERSDTSLPWFQQLPQQRQQQQQHQSHYQQNRFSQTPRKSRVLDDIDREAPNVCEFIEDRLYFMWTSINPISTRRTTYLTIDNYLQYSAFFSDFGPFDIADVFRFCSLMKERLELAKMQGKILCLHTKPEDDKRANAAFAICCYMMLLYNKTPEEAYAPIEHVHPPITPYRDAGSGSITYALSILDCLRGLRKGLDLGILQLDQFDVKEYEHYERVSNGDFNWITPFFIAFAGPRDKLAYSELQKYRTDAVALLPVSKRHTSRSKSKSGTTALRCNATSGEGTSSEPESTATESCFEATASESSSTVSSRTTPPPRPPNPSDCNDSKSTHKEGKARRKRKKYRTRLTKSFQSVLDYFETHDVKCVIRLNDKTYDEEHFQTLGMDHVDLIYPDGTCPPWYIVEQFLSICEELILDTESQEEQRKAVAAGATGGVQHVRIKKGRVVAVHCMAGLGRTGTLIGVFLMRHFDMTAREVIAFLRLMRPGSVVGPQQNWLAQNEYRIRNRNWEQTQSRVSEGCRQKLRRMPGDMKAQTDADFEAVSSTRDAWLVPDSSSISLTPTSTEDYEQIFSRANSEGLESTWSETDFDSESESEFETLDSPIEVKPEGGFSSGLRNESTFEADENDFQDVNSATAGDYDEAMSMSTDFDTSDEDSERSLEYHMPIPVNRSHAHSALSASLIGPSPLRTFHLHQRSLLANSQEIYSTVMSATDFIPEKMDADLIHNNLDSTGKEKSENAVEMADQLQPQSLGMEHIGDRQYAIPVQPRKQQHAHIENSSSDASSDGSTPPGSAPFSNLTLQPEIEYHNDGAYTEGATPLKLVIGESLQVNRFFPQTTRQANQYIDDGGMGSDSTNMDNKSSTVLLPDKTSFTYIPDPPSPPSFNNDDDNSAITDAVASSSAMTTIQGDVMKSSFPEWPRQRDIVHSYAYRQHKSSRTAGL